MAFLVGLMIGTLRLPYSKISATMDSPWPVLIAAIIGFVLVVVLEKQFEKHHIPWEA
jgi:putative membrane protein